MIFTLFTLSNINVVDILSVLSKYTTSIPCFLRKENLPI